MTEWDEDAYLDDFEPMPLPPPAQALFFEQTDLPDRPSTAQYVPLPPSTTTELEDQEEDLDANDDYYGFNPNTDFAAYEVSFGLHSDEADLAPEATEEDVELAAHKERLHWFASRIQALWRGYSVRKRISHPRLPRALEASILLEPTLAVNPFLSLPPADEPLLSSDSDNEAATQWVRQLNAQARHQREQQDALAAYQAEQDGKLREETDSLQVTALNSLADSATPQDPQSPSHSDKRREQREQRRQRRQLRQEERRRFRQRGKQMEAAEADDKSESPQSTISSSEGQDSRVPLPRGSRTAVARRIALARKAGGWKEEWHRPNGEVAEKGGRAVDAQRALKISEADVQYWANRVKLLKTEMERAVVKIEAVKRATAVSEIAAAMDQELRMALEEQRAIQEQELAAKRELVRCQKNVVREAASTSLATHYETKRQIRERSRMEHENNARMVQQSRYDELEANIKRKEQIQQQRVVNLLRRVQERALKEDMAARQFEERVQQTLAREKDKQQQAMQMIRESAVMMQHLKRLKDEEHQVLQAASKRRPDLVMTC
eukprot:TRINITY_DN20326_c0_g1_i1.p2 TRINITY_DN20326_c0_g1~~TRINITY_DN20326_c0_g1_i1.p2  ORF type:complete len:551 (-),score=123.47 TRINITY_DN20326_c0_g1_i1:2406-4058(-)